jgi:hypothetical protein
VRRTLLVLGHAPHRPPHQDALELSHKNNTHNHSTVFVLANINEANKLCIHRATLRVSSIELAVKVVVSFVFNNSPNHLGYAPHPLVDDLLRHSLPLSFPLPLTVLFCATQGKPRVSRHLIHGQACSDALISGEWPTHHCKD